jgi:hypothetical protein
MQSLPLLAILTCITAFSQQLSFTSRAYIESPVVLTSIESSKEFGFDSVVVRNDGPRPITALHLQVTFRTPAGDEVADERRVAVNLDQRDIKRLEIGLGDVEGLKQKAKSRKQPSALVILTVESIEFLDGGEWKQTERDRGIPIDPFPSQQPAPRRK